MEIEVGNPFLTWYYEFGPGHRNTGKKIYMVAFRCKYLSGEVKLSEEHSKFQWVDKDNYQKLKDKSETFKAIEKYFESSC